MKTLYISDLDGTLLDSTPKTSEYTCRTINALLKEGVVFTFATARSLITAQKVTTGLDMVYPAVVHNGTFIVDKDGTILHKNIFDENFAHSILRDILDCGLSPVVFSLINSQQKFSYLQGNLNPPTQAFINARLSDKRNHPVHSTSELFDGEIYYFTLIGDEDKTEQLYNKYKDICQCYFQRDMYSGEYWLEITEQSATKSNAILTLSQMLNCDRIVAFGDSINDISMFSISDECYAVENAIDTLKQNATAVIGSNNDDAVARWLSSQLHNRGNYE